MEYSRIVHSKISRVVAHVIYFPLVQLTTATCSCSVIGRSVVWGLKSNHARTGLFYQVAISLVTLIVWLRHWFTSDLIIDLAEADDMPGVAIVFQNHNLRYLHHLELLTQEEYSNIHIQYWMIIHLQNKQWKPTSRSTHFYQSDCRKISLFGQRAIIEVSIFHPPLYAIQETETYYT